MSARRTVLHLAAKAGLLLGALFVVTVLLAAIPSHHPPLVPLEAAPPAQEQEMDYSTMPGVDEKASERAAVHDMTPGHQDAHSRMTMTEMRPQNPSGVRRANKLVTQLRSGIEKLITTSR